MTFPQLSANLEECKLILPLENAAVYIFSNERLKDLIRKFSKVGKFYSLKGLIDPEPSELYVQHCVTFRSLIPSLGTEERRNSHCMICNKSFKSPREYEDHMSFHFNSSILPKNSIV